MANKIVPATITHRRATAAEWENANYVLDESEIGYDTTNKIIKIGDGVTAWNDLEAWGKEGLGIFRSTTSTSTGTTSISISTITVPEGRSLKVGDLIIANSTYSYLYRVTAVNASTVTVIYLQSLRGATGSRGATGTTPNISVSASVSNTTGTPSVTVTEGGTIAAPSFDFAFSGLKGSDADVPAVYEHNLNLRSEASSNSGMISFKILNNSEEEISISTLRDAIISKLGMAVSTQVYNFVVPASGLWEGKTVYGVNAGSAKYAIYIRVINTDGSYAYYALENPRYLVDKVSKII